MMHLPVILKNFECLQRTEKRRNIFLNSSIKVAGLIYYKISSLLFCINLNLIIGANNAAM